MREIYAAHIRDDEIIQTNKEHLEGTAYSRVVLRKDLGAVNLVTFVGFCMTLVNIQSSFKNVSEVAINA